MRVARSRWLTVAFATMGWSALWTGGVLAQDTLDVFRPACALVAPEAVTAVLGVEVTPADGMPDASCSYLVDDQEVASIRLGARPPLVLARLSLRRVTDTTVAGLPAVTSTTSEPAGVASVLVGLPDGGTLGVRVDRASGVDSPLAAARALAETILATGPVTAHASASTVEPLVFAGAPCELLTRAELKQLTGLTFTDATLDVDQRRCEYRTRDRGTAVAIGILTGELGEWRSTATTDLSVGGREAIHFPPTEFLAVDLGAGQLLGVRVPTAGKGIKTADLPALRTAIAETAMARMSPGAITCTLVATDAVLAATGLQLEPLAAAGRDFCWFVTPDRQTGLLLRIVAKRDVAYVRDGLRSSFSDLPAPTDHQVSGRAASVAAGPHGTLLSVRLDGSRDREVLFGLLVGARPPVVDPVAALESVADHVIAARQPRGP